MHPIYSTMSITQHAISTFQMSNYKLCTDCEIRHAFSYLNS